LPAKDHYHDTVVRALEKEGWSVASTPYTLVTEDRRLWIDIYATREVEALTMLVEVKSFSSPSPVDFLASAVGKYLIYTGLLEKDGMSTPLYMAVPLSAYESILREEIGVIARRKAKILLAVFDPEVEEILEWIT
jgi:hypothetical protein